MPGIPCTPEEKAVFTLSSAINACNRTIVQSTIVYIYDSPDTLNSARRFVARVTCTTLSESPNAKTTVSTGCPTRVRFLSPIASFANRNLSCSDPVCVLGVSRARSPLVIQSKQSTNCMETYLLKMPETRE